MSGTDYASPPRTRSRLVRSISWISTGSVRSAYSSIASRARVATWPITPNSTPRTRPTFDKIIPIEPKSPTSIGECSYERSKAFSCPLIVPAQVWDGLTADAQAGAIRLMANLASHLVTLHQESTRTEFAPCHHDSPPRKSGPSISIAKP